MIIKNENLEPAHERSVRLKPLVSVMTLFLLNGAIFVAVNYLHFRFFTVGVVLYSAVLDAVVAVILSQLIRVVVLHPLLSVSGLESWLVSLSAFLAFALYAVMGPTVVDRSLSLYILEKIDQRGGEIREAAFEDIFKIEYMSQHRLVDIRLTEQEQSGTINIANGCVSLTDRGRSIVKLSSVYRMHFLPRRRLIRGEYTDDLLNPVDVAAERVPHACIE